MTEAADHEIKIRVKASQYLALRHIAEIEERPMSSLIRKVLADYIAQACVRAAEMDRDGSGHERD
jgi:uncharacterized protein (DUF1778 family)